MKHRGCLTRLVKVGVIVLLAVVVVGIVGAIVWRTGKVQRWAVSAGIERVFGARADVEDVSLGKKAAVGKLIVYDAPSEGDESALARFDALELDYAAWPGDGRYLTRLALKNVTVDVDGRDPLNPNYDVITRFLSAPSSGVDPTPFLPKSVLVEELTVSAEMPSWSAQFRGLGVEGTIDTLDAMLLRVRGAPLHATWSVSGVETALSALEGDADVVVVREGGVMKGEIHAGLPGLATVNAMAALTGWPSEPRARINLEEITLQDELWGAMAKDALPVPIQFDALRVEDSTFDVAWPGDALSLDNVQIHAAMEGIVLGPAESPYYAGTLRFTGEGGLSNGSPLTLSATLNEGQVLRGVFHGDLAQLTADFTMENWPREHVKAVVPAAYRDVLEFVPKLTALSVSLQTEWKNPKYKVTGRLTPVLGDAGEVGVNVAAHGTVDSSPLCEGNLDTTWREGSVAVRWNLDGGSKFSAQAVLKDVSPRDWAEAWLGLEALSTWSGKVNGTVEVLSASDVNLQTKLNLNAAGPAYGSFVVPSDVSVALKADVALRDNKRVGGKTLRLMAGDSAQVTLKDWHATFDPAGAKGALECRADLGTVGSWIGVSDLQGEASLAADLSVDAAALTLSSLTLQGETVGYGDWSTPYRMPLTVKADLRAEFDGMTVASDELDMTLGEDTRIEVKGLSLARSAGEDARMVSMKGIAVNTGFAPFVSKGYLDEANGTATVKGAGISFGAQGFRGAFDYTVAAENLILAKAMAAFYGLKADGHVDYGGDLQGTGSLTAERAIAGGATLGGVRGEIRGDGKALRVANLEGMLFGGSVKAEVVVGLLEAGFPIRVSTTLENADLAIFTEEYRPPSVRLTGRIQGKASVVYGANGIEDLAVDLRTVDGMTMNRDAVAQILLSQYMGSVTAGKTLSKAVEQTIGKEADRPFDSGWLQLAYREGEIVGMAKLESRLLTLTIDIKADPETLNDAMMLRQAERVQFETVDNEPDTEVQ